MSQATNRRIRLSQIITIVILSLALEGCAAWELATLPVKATAKAVDRTTTSQQEADSNAGRKMRKASPRVAMATSISIEIVRKFADQTGFVVHPRRWVVERTFAWLNRNRRLAKDFEQTVRSATAFLYAASAMMLIRRLARYA